MTENKLNPIPIGDAPVDNAALRPWLEQQAQAHGFRWLLAHSEDGVNWGRFDDGKLVISHDVAAMAEQAYVPELAIDRLMELRLFGPDGELLLWRATGGATRGMTGRLLQDARVGAGIEVRCDKRLLWGTQSEELTQGFIVVSEDDGLRHVVPWADKATQPGPREAPGHRLYLDVRHYLDFDDDGQAYVVVSRLVNLKSQKRGEEGK